MKREGRIRRRPPRQRSATARPTSREHALLELLTTISTHFINLPSDQIDAGIDDSLRQIGEFAGVDRTYVFLFSADGNDFVRSHSWRAPGPTGPELLSPLRAGAIAWMTEKIRHGEIIYISDPSSLPPEARTEAKLMRAGGLRSVLAVPMVRGGSSIGFLGFASRRKQRWTEEILTLLHLVSETLTSVLERKRTELFHRNRERRLQADNQALVELARRQALAAGDLEGAAREIDEVAAHTLNVQRASIWLFTEDRGAIRNLDLYDAGTDTHSSGAEIQAIDYPAYFAALEEERSIDAHDARSDPRTSELAESYLAPHGITATLDAPVRLGGRVVGVICHEHVGPPRRWTIDERRFAASVADLVSLALESRDRRRPSSARPRSSRSCATSRARSTWTSSCSVSSGRPRRFFPAMRSPRSTGTAGAEPPV